MENEKEVPTKTYDVEGKPISFEAMLLGALIARVGGTVSLSMFELMNVEGLSVSIKEEKEKSDKITIVGNYHVEVLAKEVQHMEDMLCILQGGKLLINYKNGEENNGEQ